MSLKKIQIHKGTRVEFHSNELLFLAKSGQPYRGSLYVKFESQGESFDLVDFKRYITSLRCKTLNAEDIAYELYSTIENSINAKNLGVVVDLSARGGLQQRLSFGSEFIVTKKNNIFQVGE
jgi:NADPH-dependent 7-cyano-7-deazaguanine reductase QueF